MRMAATVHSFLGRCMGHTENFLTPRYGIGVFVVILGFLGILVVQAVSPDEQFEQLIQDGIDFNTLALKSTRAPKQNGEIPALVHEARLFSKHLDPSLPRAQESSAPSTSLHTTAKPRQPRRSHNLKPKFVLHGTSISRSQPAKSSALIWEPGAGQRWVKTGDMIGYCTVDQIYRGRITYRHQAGSAEMSIMSTPPDSEPLHHRVMAASQKTPETPELPYVLQTYNENQRGNIRESVGSVPLADSELGPLNPTESQVISAGEFPEVP